MVKSSQQLVAEAKCLVQEISVIELAQRMKANELVIIDVREPDEFLAGHIDASINYPRGVLEMKIHNHPCACNEENAEAALEKLAHLPIYLICRSGARSALAALALKQMGFEEVYSVAGGFMAWTEQGLPVSHCC